MPQPLHTAAAASRLCIHGHVAIQYGHHEWMLRVQLLQYIPELPLPSTILCYLVLYQLDTNWSHLGRGNLSQESASIGLSASLRGIFLIDECGRSQPTVSGASTGQVTLQQSQWAPSEQASKQHFSMVTASILPPGWCRGFWPCLGCDAEVKAK